MTPFIQVVTTVEKKEDAERIADALIASKLAACVQINNCTSVFSWRGEVQKSEEWVLTVKSSHALFSELCLAVEEMHPYDVPEILALPILEGSKKYLYWLEEELKEAIDVD
ncbi:MAG: divalent-cation tolerance protein CutA [Desulfobulbaceae bacterium]|nr:divalent-cation tolerance protein CutA [Desulfobulbaceae bacterium]